MHIGGLGHALDVRGRETRGAVGDVVRDGRVEKVPFLADDRDVVAEVRDVRVADVVSTDGDGARGRFVETLEEGGDLDGDIRALGSGADVAEADAAGDDGARRALALVRDSGDAEDLLEVVGSLDGYWK